MGKGSLLLPPPVMLLFGRNNNNNLFFLLDSNIFADGVVFSDFFLFRQKKGSRAHAYYTTHVVEDGREWFKLLSEIER